MCILPEEAKAETAHPGFAHKFNKMKVQAFFKNSSGWVENGIGNSIPFIEYENGTLGWDEQPTRLMKWIASKAIKFYRSSGISEFEFNTELLRRKYDYYKIIQQNFAG